MHSHNMGEESNKNLNKSGRIRRKNKVNKENNIKKSLEFGFDFKSRSSFI